MTNGELTGHLAVYGHMLVSDDLRLLLWHLERSLGDLQIPPKSLHLYLHHRSRRNIKQWPRLRGNGQRQPPPTSIARG
jgi:hypothetical protein